MTGMANIPAPPDPETTQGEKPSKQPSRPTSLQGDLPPLPGEETHLGGDVESTEEGLVIGPSIMPSAA